VGKGEKRAARVKIVSVWLERVPGDYLRADVVVAAEGVSAGTK